MYKSSPVIKVRSVNTGATFQTWNRYSNQRHTSYVVHLVIKASGDVNVMDDAHLWTDKIFEAD